MDNDCWLARQSNKVKFIRHLIFFTGVCPSVYGRRRGYPRREGVSVQGQWVCPGRQSVCQRGKWVSQRGWVYWKWKGWVLRGMGMSKEGGGGWVSTPWMCDLGYPSPTSDTLWCNQKQVVCILLKWFLVFIFSAFLTHLGIEAGVKFPPNSQSFCKSIVTPNFSGFLCSTLLVVSMTFDRFYSILMPLKAPSFNTVKRAKITIVCIYLFAFAYNIPHIFLVDGQTYQCVPYGKVDQILIVWYITGFPLL